MAGSDTAVDPDKMTNSELHNHFTHLVSDHMQDVDKRFVETMEKIEGLETSFTDKLDAKFRELLRRIPPPTYVGRAQRVPLPHAHTSAAGAAGATATDARYEEYEGEDDSDGENEDEGEVHQPPPGRPRVLLRNARPLVRDDDHVTKLKLNIPPFDGRYNPDAYLS